MPAVWGDQSMGSWCHHLAWPTFGFISGRSAMATWSYSVAWEIGIILAPEHRGRGVGTTAQRLLAEYLFDTTLVHRLCAYTESDNVVERKSLERCGFRREGLLRQAGFRGGSWRDVVIYALLRSDVDATSDSVGGSQLGQEGKDGS